MPLVLSIAKLRVGQEAYQLSGVAQSLDDYYTGVGESSGQWAGIGAARLGLDGDVNADDLRAVLAGMRPGTGGLTPDGETIRAHPRRVPGFDLTFKAPKSVSVLYAVTDDPRVQHEIVEAGEAAVRSTLAWLEREVIHVRRGNGRADYINDLAARDPAAAEAARIRTLPASGAVAAVFRHRTSRAGDPLLHWHTLVANLAEGPDHRWTAIVHPDLYRAVRTAGEVFQTVLRDELTERLGLTWRPGRHVSEVAGVPQGLLDTFSKRSREIEQWLEATGTPGDRAGRQAAVLATRRAKPEVEHERFDAAWKREAIEHGWGPEHAEALIANPGTRPATDVIVDDRWVAAIARQLTEHDSTFTRNDLLRAVAASLQDGAPMRVIEQHVAAVIASPTIVSVGNTPGRWTSSELLATERRLLDTAIAGIATRAPLPSENVTQALGGFATIGHDQRLAVERIASSRDAVSVLVGPAGTGKTYTLDAIRTAYQTAGYQVIGVAPSARAAHELSEGAHVKASTIHRLTGSWGRGYDLPGPATVMIVDEAAMAGTRDLDAIIATTVGAGGRVLLVGDHHQLPEVTAGGAFAAIATGGAVTVAELTVNRRQHHEWEREALTELRDGHVAKAVAAYRNHDRLRAAPDHPTMLAVAIEEWANARADGLTPVLIGGTNSTVDALNTAARARVAKADQLGDVVAIVGNRTYAIGDQIVLRANHYTAVDTDGRPCPLLNGHTATVTGPTATGGAEIRLHHNAATVQLDHQTLAASVDYAYALTAHRAQGGTWDLAIAVGTDGLYREAGYLALSRGRHANLLVITQSDIDAIDHDLARHDSTLHLPDETAATHDDLIHRLNQSRAKSLALTQDPHADLINRLAATDLATLETLGSNASAAEQRALAIVGVQPDEAQTRIERATFVATHVAVGHTVKPADRNNIGTVTSLDDSAGTVNVEFNASDGRVAERSFRWDELTIVDPKHPAVRPLNAEAELALNHATTHHSEAIERWNTILAERNTAPDDAYLYTRAARLHIDRAAAAAIAAPKPWLSVFGARPTSPAGSQVWDDAVRDVAAFRARHLIDDLTRPLGAAPAVGGAAWNAAVARLVDAVAWLDLHDQTEPTARFERSAEQRADRRAHLDSILATAPADQRRVINAIANGQLTLDELTDVLENANAGQGARQRWIIEHWPHVVESAELDRAATLMSAEANTHEVVELEL